MSFASLRVFTYAYPVLFLSKWHAKNRKEVLAVQTSYRKKFLRFYHAAAKKFLRFPGLKVKRPAISRKNFFLQTQKEVLACALFLGCTVCRPLSQEKIMDSQLGNWEFLGWDLSHFAKFGILRGIL